MICLWVMFLFLDGNLNARCLKRLNIMLYVYIVYLALAQELIVTLTSCTLKYHDCIKYILKYKVFKAFLIFNH